MRNGRIALLDHDALLAGDAAGAVARVARDSGPYWYRGWMVPSARYAELEAALGARGCALLTDARLTGAPMNSRGGTRSSPPSLRAASGTP